MIALAISLLWLLAEAIILAGVVWLILYGIKRFIVAIPANLEAGIWFIVLILILIGALTLLETGSVHGPNLKLR